MGSEIQCFWLTPIDQGERSLRRYAGNKACPGPHGYHNAEVNIGKVRIKARAMVHATEWPRCDPRWPAACLCGYRFTPEDAWQTNIEPYYRRGDNGCLTTQRDAPVGAMYDAWWLHRKGPDGICLVVRTPGGDWTVDWPSNTGQPWARTGHPPKVTATPSIIAGKYHGWLTDGVLKEC